MNPATIGAIAFGALALLALVIIYIIIRTAEESGDEFTGEVDREP